LRSNTVLMYCSPVSETDFQTSPSRGSSLPLSVHFLGVNLSGYIWLI
jgi:hypothetical protein